MQKKVFITGATGFLGSYLLRLLVKEGYDIMALKRHNSPMNMVEEVKNDVEWIDGDILDVPLLEEVMENADQVYHSAAVVSFSPKDRERLFRINEKGTEAVVNACLSAGVDKLLHVSSISSLGRVKSGDTLDENTKWETSKMNSNYAVSKYLAEMQVQRGIAEGLEAAIVNPSMIMGSGFWDRGTAKMFTTMAGNFPFYPVGGTGVVDVRDVAEFSVKLMNSDISGERFVLNGEDISHQKLFKIIAESVGAKPPRRKITPLLREITWRAEWLRSKLTGANPLYTKENAITTAQTFYYKNDKSRSVFDFKYRAVEETVRDAGKQFLKSKKEGRMADFLPFK